MLQEPTLRALAGLKLTQADLEDLARQGFVSSEMRGSGRRHFKLRFRSGRKQVVRYIGTDLNRVARIQREIETLQSDGRAQQHLQRQVRSARKALRESKRNLAPLLLDSGLRYHGYAIRRSRL